MSCRDAHESLLSAFCAEFILHPFFKERNALLFAAQSTASAVAAEAPFFIALSRVNVRAVFAVGRIRAHRADALRYWAEVRAHRPRRHPRVPLDSPVVFGHEPTEVAHRLSNAFLIAVMTSRRSSGSMRAESTVEPTRSEKALGGVPRAASTTTGPGVGAALAYGRCIDCAAQGRCRWRASNGVILTEQKAAVARLR
jgi:hypothetical protein